MNEIQKNDFVYFRNEILKDMKQIETKINEKVINLYSSFKKISTENDEKINLIDLKLKALQNNDPIILENKINSKFEKTKTKFEEKFDDMGVKINLLQKDLSNACFKYDKIVIDNLKVTGLVGEACPYSSLKYYIEFIHKKINELTLSRDKLNNELKLVNNKINDIVIQVKSDLEQQKYIIGDMTSSRLTDANNKFLERDKLYEERINSLRLENYNFSNDLIKKTEELNIQWDKLEHIKDEIYEKFNDEKKTFRKYCDYLSNLFNSQKKDFNLIKSRFTDMSNVFKIISTNRNTLENIDRREILKVSKKLDFNKKQKLSKEDSEMLNKESKENNFFKNTGTENTNTNNDHDSKKKKKLDFDDSRKEDSFGADNINTKENKEEENNMKFTDENFENENDINLYNVNTNKNNRKSNINQNNSITEDNKNIYTKIAIKSVNKKSKEEENLNINADNINEQFENYEQIDTKLNNENIDFSNPINKNLLLKLKKKNSLKKININNKNEKEDLTLIKNNLRKKLLLNENDKINEFLSLSNEANSHINNFTNTTPYNLKLKKLFKKFGSRKNEAISPLNLEHSFLKLNSDKENIFYHHIIQYLNTTSHRINNLFDNISLKLEINLNSIKKEINQIYNDVNMLSLNNNQPIRKSPPFYFKINNFDLNNSSSFQLNMENFKHIYRPNFLKNKPNERNFSPGTPRNILNNIEPYLIKKFKEKK